MSLARRVVIPLAVVLAASFVMLPRLGDANFGLLDDGASLFWGSLGADTGVLPTAVEAVRQDGERGRFHPVEVLYTVGMFQLFGYDAALWFALNGLLLAATALMVARIVWVGSRDEIAALFSGLGFLLFPSVFEGYYTLSKGDPLMVALIVTSVWLLFESVGTRGWVRGAIFLASGVSLSLAYYAKETALGMTATSVLWALLEWRRSHRGEGQQTGSALRWFCAINVTLFFSFFLARWWVGIAPMATSSDSGHYLAAALPIVESALRYAGWWLRDYAHVLVALAFAAFLPRAGRGGPETCTWLLGIAVAWVLGAIAIMLPWHSSLLYYLLPMNPGAAMILGLGLSAALRSLRVLSRGAAALVSGGLALFAVLAAASCSSGLTHGRVQVAVDKANAEMVKTLVTIAPPNGVVVAYLPVGTEYLDEIGRRLQGLERRGDIRLASFEKEGPPAVGTLAIRVTMKNRPRPSVRVGVWETGASAWAEEAERDLAGRGELVWETTERVRLAVFGLEQPVFNTLLGERRWSRLFYSDIAIPWLDFRELEYGWQIHRLLPGPSPSRSSSP